MTPWDSGLPLRRLGGQGDGGYLVPDDLSGIEALLSPGVAESWEFERFVGDSLFIPSYMIDGSVDAPPGLTELQHFERLWLGTTSNSQSISLADWVMAVSTTHLGDLMLQMDIEGAEYRILSHAPQATLRRFRVVVVEYHGLDWMLTYPALRFRILPALRQMAVHFEVVHVHPNNCCGTVQIGGVEVPRVLEVTYIRRDRIRNGQPQRAELPHPLDRDCVPSNPSVELGPRWPQSDLRD